MFVLVDPTSFLSVEQIQERATAVAEHLRDETVRLPGEGAYEREIAALEQGLEIPDHVVASLARLASDLNVETPAEFADGSSASPESHKSLKSW
jgi:LDH2 family malate/lactate/ureidoglycolate dehydrogenase